MSKAQFNTSDVPVPTARAPNLSGTTVRRAKTLTRPERSVAPVPLIKPAEGLTATLAADTSGFDPWKLFSRIVTFWAPAFLLNSVGGMHDKNTIQAWREKMALCFIAIVMGGFVGFATVGLQKTLCPQTSASTRSTFIRYGSVAGTIGVQGYLFNASGSSNSDILKYSQQAPGQDITALFQRSASNYPSCNGLTFRVALDDPCATGGCTLGALNSSSTFTGLGITNTTALVGYDWDDVAALDNYFVIDGAVLDMNPYFKMHPNSVPTDTVDAALRSVIAQTSSGGKDGTKLFTNRADLKSAMPCLTQRYYAGNIDKITPGCFISQLFLYLSLIAVLSLVLLRFVMACVFSWFLSARLTGSPSSSELSRHAISPAVMPAGANVSIDNKTGTAPWSGQDGNIKKLTKSGESSQSLAASSTGSDTPTPIMSLTQIGAELFAVCLVTCYSEGEDSLRTTLDSISTTDYSDHRKLLFVVADGMITGAGEKKSTPDICVSLLEADPRFGNPQPMSYLAVGSGAKQENRAMVYAGHYTVAGRRTPTVVIVKCGTEREAATEKKPGNRGKRDSQLILMNFFSRVTYNDRMTPLDFDLFRKLHVLMGVTPDFFEVCLMVDADTKVLPDSLKYLVNCMHNDQMIMGCCGETRIANKRQSWVTAIQVYEYFISHHMVKAFESVFGGVSCLPGCFSMFRLKARKASGDDWVPLIIKPEIVKEYSQSIVTTLHQKNLLLLGEDRFLTTILLRTFPNRKMVFLPQARCRTVVPDTFSMLLSQRRRWINSTVHNLMELVLVRDLCGTFCFSMQFAVFMDLVGTTVLPIAIVLTYSLIVNTILHPPKTFEEAIPTMLLIAVLGLPAVLILITTRKVVYVFWMGAYLLALPVWNFVLPVYAFWHFDDFSWGETRKVEGEGKDTGHGDGGGSSETVHVSLRRWEDWERSRLRKIKRDEKRRREFERTHGGYLASDDGLLTPRRSMFDGSDTVSVTSSEDDRWGQQIGGYNEENGAYPPPPHVLGARTNHSSLASAQTIGGSEMEAILEQGFEESPASSRTQFLPPAPNTRVARYQLSDSGSAQYANGGNGYTPLSRSTSPGLGPTVFSPTTPGMPESGALSTAISGKGHIKRRSGNQAHLGSQEEKYGPLGPLDPDQ